MKAFSITVLLLVVLNSCNHTGSLNGHACENLAGIDYSLYNVILSYQKMNPIPIIAKYDVNLPPPPQTAFKYIYEVQFKIEQDTLITICLKPDGVESNQDNFDNRIYGVYQDSCLKPTYLISDSNLVKDFIKLYKRENMDSFRYDNSTNIDFWYDRYVYKIINSRIVFEEKIKGNIKE